MITAFGKYKVVGTIQQNLLTDTQTWISNPIVGDMRITHSYTRWKDFGGVKFYTDSHSHMFAGGEYDPLQYRILGVKGNVTLPADAFAVPAAVQQATRPPATSPVAVSSLRQRVAAPRLDYAAG